MILEIDMGNSRIKWRCRGESGNLARGVVSDSYQHLAAEWTALPIRRVWVASVRGEAHNEAFRQWCRTNLQLEAEFARSARHAAGVTNSYANPGLMGVDRWLAMLAAFAHTGGSCVVVQAGSALTADLLSASGEHLGGYIGPGLSMMQRALANGTAQVGSKGGVWDRLSVTPGTDTAGAVKGALGAMALGLVTTARTQLGAANASLLVTGGDGPALAAHLPNARLMPELVLDGLALALSDQ